jgi:hypothetical protein
MITEQQFMELALALIQVDEDSLSMKAIRTEFHNRDRQWSSHDVRAEYRLREYKAIQQIVENGSKLGKGR